MICLRRAHSFAMRQLMTGPEKAHRRANYVRVLNGNSAILAGFVARSLGPFCKLLHYSL